MRELLANAALKKQGSVMAKPQQPKWRTDSPLLDTSMSMLDKILSFGPTPQDALPASKLANKVFGGALGTSLAGVNTNLDSGGEEAGIYRDLGRMRQAGSLNPAQYISRIMQIPNYARAKQLFEWMARRDPKLGEQFSGYRGRNIKDPLTMLPMKVGTLPSATAISTNPHTAKGFVSGVSDERITQGQYTPESILSLLPKRGSSYANEAELIVDPRWANKFDVTSAPTYGSKTQTADPLTTAAMNEALDRIRTNRPLPGSGAHTNANYSEGQMKDIMTYIGNKIKQNKEIAKSNIGSNVSPKKAKQIDDAFAAQMTAKITNYDSPSNKGYLGIIPIKPKQNLTAIDDPIFPDEIKGLPPPIGRANDPELYNTGAFTSNPFASFEPSHYNSDLDAIQAFQAQNAKPPQFSAYPHPPAPPDLFIPNKGGQTMEPLSFGNFLIDLAQEPFQGQGKFKPFTMPTLPPNYIAPSPSSSPLNLDALQLLSDKLLGR